MGRASARGRSACSVARDYGHRESCARSGGAAAAALSAYRACVSDGSDGRAGDREEHLGGPLGGVSPQESGTSRRDRGGSDEPVFGRSDSGRPDSNARARRGLGHVHPLDGDARISRRAGTSNGGGGAVARRGGEKARLNRNGGRRAG